MKNIFKKTYNLFSTSIKWTIQSNIKKYKRKKKNPVHILFCMVDHYEPGTGGVTVEIAKNRVQLLISEYPKIAERHKDHYGNPAKRTWFYPPHYHCDYHLKNLVSLCEKGYGEIELHLHHGKAVPDTADNLENTLKKCIEEYSYFGIFGTENGQKKYGFIHGDWALDNSRFGKYCGVNNEISILRKTGCYADFTFPSMNESSPKKINSIYYAKDDPSKPKSHNSGTPVEIFKKETGDLMMIEGPLYPLRIKNNFFGLRIRGDFIDGQPPVTKERIDKWIKTGICVKGKEEWIIIKTHTHGATDHKAVLGQEMDDIFSYLESKYNDGVNYILHYLTARELYNIIKAAEAGKTDLNPEKYRDYKISPPKYNSSPDIPSASDELQELILRTYKG